MVGVAPGYNTTTVDAVVVTADGDQPLLMVLDEDGKLLAWKWSQQVQPIEATALEFVRYLADERWVLARTKLSLQLQEELSPADLERKWSKLNSVSGGFRKVKDAVIASQGGPAVDSGGCGFWESDVQPFCDLRQSGSNHQRRHLKRFRLSHNEPITKSGLTSRHFISHTWVALRSSTGWFRTANG